MHTLTKEKTWSPLWSPDSFPNHSQLLSQLLEGMRTPKGDFHDTLGYHEGRTGRAIFCLELGIFLEDPQLIAQAEGYFKELIDWYFEGTHTLDYADGLAGMAWALAKANSFPEVTSNFDNFLRFADEKIQKYLRYVLFRNNLDLFSGVPGLFPYLLLRADQPGNREALKEAIDFFTEQYAEAPDAFWKNTYNGGKAANLTMAHGLPAIGAVLLAVHDAGLFQEQTRPLVEQIIAFILTTELHSAEHISCFTFILDTTREVGNSRMAWCQGDLTLGQLIFRAGVSLDRPEWIEKGLAVLETTVKRRTQEETMVVDTSFCHGTVGLGHMYNRLHKYTGMEVFREAAEYWLKATLKELEQHPDYAIAMIGEMEGEKTFTRMDGLSMGTSGVGLSLIAALSARNPWWDEGLLLSHSNGGQA